VDASASTVIDRPIEQVFAFVTDIARMPAWVSGVTGARMVSGVMEQGARFVLAYQPGRRETELEVAVEAYEPPSRFAFSTERGPFAFSGRLELVPEGTRTRVSSIIEADPDSVSTKMANLLLGGYIRRSMVRRLDRELSALRDAIAADPNVRN